MKFTEITAEQFQKYARTSPYQSFMQTPEIAQLRQNLGWTPYFLAVIDDKLDDKIVDASTKSKKSTSRKSQKSIKSSNTKSSKTISGPTPKILAATLVVAKPTFLGHQIFYAPGGPLLDLENTELTNFFFVHLIAFAREHKAFILHIDPYYELIERDIDGNLVQGGFNHQTALDNLQALGFRPLTHTSMPRYLFVKDLKQSDTPEEVFKHFKQNTRNLTRRAERLGVKIRELNRKELPILKQITADTAARRHFTDQPLSYYQTMYDLFAPQNQVKFLLAEVADTTETTETTEVTETTEAIKATKTDTSNSATSAESEITSAKTTPLSVAMFMLVGSEVVYLYSGSDKAYMKKYNAQYLIQWHMIKYALEHDFKRYNFYGIRALPTDPKAPGYGVYRFKKGFGGHVVELIGSFELPLNQPIFRLHSTLAKLKNLIH